MAFGHDRAEAGATDDAAAGATDWAGAGALEEDAGAVARSKAGVPGRIRSPLLPQAASQVNATNKIIRRVFFMARV